MVEGQPDYAGYPDLDSLVKGYRNSGEEAKKQREEAIRQKARADMLEQHMAQQIPQRDSQGRFQSNDPAKQLTDYGVPVEALDAYVGRKIQSAFEPLSRGMQARDRLMSEYQDYAKYEPEAIRFALNDPETSARYNNMFASDPVGAMEYAYLKFGSKAKANAEVNGNGAQPQQIAQRADAQIPSNRMGQGPSPASSQDEVKSKAWERYQKTGDPTAYAKARLREAVSDDFLGR
jgi:hypothetical protein